ncbi:hypothetical protein NXC12_CH03027 [Rhizobium etli]|uniref:Uncharacterized protein n=1 Tax=Rhizobium etli TaxID=29449 RepID=A0AAN1EKM5_RHIET|nr:hypothetical protein [Rhizobium etli]ARQ11020.1 hypothetical protein NXC12_CH03027 [Rhizobium etli]
MKPTRAVKILKEEASKRLGAAERFRRYIQDLRHRQRMKDERDRRRKWLLALLLAMLESKPAQAFFPVVFAEPDPAYQKRQPQPTKKSEKNVAADDPRTDDERRYLYDYAPRRGEEHLEVYDGLTYSDIIAKNKIYRPWLFPKFEPIPGMPERYADGPVHIWTLLDHLGSDYHRPEAITALKLIVGVESHDWIDACAAEVDGLTWKDLRRQCRRRTPEMTLHEFPRSATRWRDEQRRETEERKREVDETPDDGLKPPNID